MISSDQKWISKAKEFLHKRVFDFHDATTLVQLLYFNNILPDRSQITLKNAYEVVEDFIAKADEKYKHRSSTGQACGHPGSK